MKTTPNESFSRERAMEAAERLFSRRGFSSVTLRDIGAELGLSHASLYYHFPRGKEELFIEVTERTILRHGSALAAVIAETCCDVRTRLHGAAAWFLSQPPLDLIRMAESDMPVLKPEEARRLMELMHAQILRRLQAVLQEADEDGSLHCTNPALVAGAIVGMIESFHSMPEMAIRVTKIDMAKEMLDILLRGLEYRGFADGAGIGADNMETITKKEKS